MDMSHKVKLLAVFVVSTLLGLWAYIQTPEFVFNFPMLANTTLVKNVAPRTENMLRFAAFRTEILAIPDAKKAPKLCALMGKYFNFSPTFTIPHQEFIGAYRAMLIGCLLEGEGTPKNPELAAKLAATPENFPPKVIVPMGAEFIKANQNEVGTKLLEFATRNGDSAASGALASFYMNGNHGFPLSWEKARDLYQQGADKGDAFSALNLAFMAMVGRPGQPNPEVFRKYIELSLAKRPDKASGLLLSCAYQLGFGYPQNAAKAQELDAKAQTYPSVGHYYVTDFFNAQGWGGNPQISQWLLLRHDKAGLIDYTGQREQFFTASGGPTPMFTALQNSLLSSNLDKEQVNIFLRNFSAPQPMKATGQ